jgi:hypothetical protein
MRVDALTVDASSADRQDRASRAAQDRLGVGPEHGHVQRPSPHDAHHDEIGVALGRSLENRPMRFAFDDVGFDGAVVAGGRRHQRIEPRPARLFGRRADSFNARIDRQQFVQLRRQFDRVQQRQAGISFLGKLQRVFERPKGALREVDRADDPAERHRRWSVLAARMRRDNHDGPAGSPENAIGRRSQQESLEPRTAMAADDEQIRRQPAGLHVDFVSDSRPLGDAHLDAGGRGHLGHESSRRRRDRVAVDIRTLMTCIASSPKGALVTTGLASYT